MDAGSSTGTGKGRSRRGHIENCGGSKIEENPYEFFVSDQAEKFRTFADSILPIDITTAKQVPIEEY